MTLDELRTIALEDTIEIQWESLETKQNQEDFVRILTHALTYIDELESLYTKISSGDSITFLGKEEPLTWSDKELLLNRAREELVASYQLADTYNRYMSVQSLINGDSHA